MRGLVELAGDGDIAKITGREPHRDIQCESMGQQCRASGDGVVVVMSGKAMERKPELREALSKSIWQRDCARSDRSGGIEDWGLQPEAQAPAQSDPWMGGCAFTE